MSAIMKMWKKDDYCYRPPTKLRKGNVFSCVCLFVHGGGVPMWPLPMMHWNSLYRDIPQPHPSRPWVWDLTVQGHPTRNIRWPTLETCSTLLTWGPHALVLTSDIWWLLKHVRLASGQQVSSFEYFLVKRKSSQFLDHNQSAQRVMEGWTDRQNFYNFY